MDTPTTDRLLERLRNGEDNLVERKPKFDSNDVREAVVAFANSLRGGDTGILFIGVTDRGFPYPQAQLNPDKTQKDVASSLERCFPEIPNVSMYTLRLEDSPVVAVVVGESARRPHFTGHAYVRVGSTSRKASAQMFDELLADRVSGARVLRPWIDKEVRVQQEQQHPVGRYPPQWSQTIRQCVLLDVTPRGIRLKDGSPTDLCPTWERVDVEESTGHPPLIRIALWGRK